MSAAGRKRRANPQLGGRSDAEASRAGRALNGRESIRSTQAAAAGGRSPRRTPPRLTWSARPRQSNAAHDAGIDGKGVGSSEGDSPGWVNIHGHVYQQDSPSSNRHINVSVEQLNCRPVRLSDVRRLTRRLMEGRTVPGPSTRARLNIVEIAMP